jgi:hypothetical protein
VTYKRLSTGYPQSCSGVKNTEYIGVERLFHRAKGPWGKDVDEMWIKFFF